MTSSWNRNGVKRRRRRDKRRVYVQFQPIGPSKTTLIVCDSFSICVLASASPAGRRHKRVNLPCLFLFFLAEPQSSVSFFIFDTENRHERCPLLWAVTDWSYRAGCYWLSGWPSPSSWSSAPSPSSSYSKVHLIIYSPLFRTPAARPSVLSTAQSRVYI